MNHHEQRTYQIFIMMVSYNTVEQVIFADMLFSRSADFAIPRILIFADVGAGNTRSCIALLSYTYFLFLMNYY